MTTFVHKGGGGSKLPEILSTWFVHGPLYDIKKFKNEHSSPKSHGPSQRLQEMAEMAVRGSRRIFLGANVNKLVTVRGCF